MSTPPEINPDDASFVYDEMAFFDENCREYEIERPDRYVVRRINHPLTTGGHISALQWGAGSPLIVFVHGGAQNAHTWDTVLLALGQPAALCVDLPGHGHSSRRDDDRYDPRSNADAIAETIAALAPAAAVVVGMSLGGLTVNALAAEHGELVRRGVIIDVTPGVNSDKAKAVTDFIAGPQAFANFGEIFDRTVEYNPTRTQESLRRGILHNAHRLSDGSWEWNYDRRQLGGAAAARFGDLWADVSASTCPYLLVRGAVSPVVDDDDEAELMRRRPDARVIHVEGAGHSVQGDRPLELAEILRAELNG